MAFRPYEPQRTKTPRSKSISREEWERHRNLIGHLYLRQKLTQHGLLQVLKKDVDFHPSPKQLTTQLAEWSMFKNNSKRNDATRPPVDANTRAGADRLNEQHRIEDEADENRMTNDPEEDSPYYSGGDIDSFWREDEELSGDVNPATAETSPAVAACQEEEATAVVWQQDLSPSAHHPSEITTPLLQTDNMNQSTITYESHFEARSTRANVLLPDVIFDSRSSNPNPTLGGSDIDDFSSQLELALSQEWIQGGIQEPWNEFGYRDSLE